MHDWKISAVYNDYEYDYLSIMLLKSVFMYVTFIFMYVTYISNFDKMIISKS